MGQNLICASIWQTGKSSSPVGHLLSGWDDCRAWVHSILRSRIANTRVVVFAHAISPELHVSLRQSGVEVIDWTPKPTQLHPSAVRWEPIIAHLEQNCYDYVIATDIRDVVFQADPFPYLRSKGGIVLATESMPLHRCGDNYLWLKQYLGLQAELIKNRETVCGGTIAGQYSSILELLRQLYSCARPGIIDQAILNHLAHAVLRPHIPRLNEGFILSGAWCWEPNILDPQPEIRNSIAYPRGSHNPFKIWHLYINRYWDEVRRLYWEK
jgi:hypothetical protein